MGAAFGTGVDPTLKEHHTKNKEILTKCMLVKVKRGGWGSKCVSENDLPLKINFSKIFVTI